MLALLENEGSGFVPAHQQVEIVNGQIEEGAAVRVAGRGSGAGDVNASEIAKTCAKPLQGRPGGIESFDETQSKHKT